MKKLISLGVLVPSSNTALEPLTQMMISSIEDSSLQISVHFSRFKVTQINTSPESKSQFDLERILSAAELLSDAKVQVIGWSGTSAGWLGFDTDETLCIAIEEKTGIKATTSTLSLNQLLQKSNTSSFALLTPYTEDMNFEIQTNYRKIGIRTTIQQHSLGIMENVRIAEIEENVLDRLVEDAAKDPPAIVTFCTNLRAAQRVAYWEKEHGCLVFDTVSAVIWGMLCIAGVNPTLVNGWGRMFDIS